MTLYLNINQLFESLIGQQQHIERCIGFKQVVDVVYNHHINIANIAAPDQRKIKALLIAQTDLSENGLYQTDAFGVWHRLVGTLELGNLVACRTAQQYNQYDYYKLQELVDDKQIWQRFSLGDLHT